MAGAPVIDDVRLLRGIRDDVPLTVAEHHALHGQLPSWATDRRGRGRPTDPFPREIATSGLTGRGGAGFPFATKLAAVAAARGRPVVVVNAAESEPAAQKDAVLLTCTPHLVLDGAEVTARHLGTQEIVVWTHAGADAVNHSVRTALAQRHEDLDWKVVTGPARYVAGEASAVARSLSGDVAKPRTVPPHVSVRGVDNRPTLLSNAETFAHVGLITRHGGAWFRSVGTPQEPGTLLLTLTGAVTSPGAVEVPFGTPFGEVIEACGGLSALVDQVLIGGYAGRWAPWSRIADLPVSRVGLSEHGWTLGVGVLGFLPSARCGVAETAALVRWLAGESAGQCGPCVRGLPAMARAFDQLTTRGDRRIPGLLQRWSDQLDGRGACAHPSGVVALVRSALRAFPNDVQRHAERGRAGCAKCEAPAVFDIPRHPARRRLATVGAELLDVRR